MTIPVTFSPSIIGLQTASPIKDSLTNDGATLVILKNEKPSNVTMRIQTQIGSSPHSSYHRYDILIPPSANISVMGPFSRAFNDDLGNLKIEWLSSLLNPMGDPSGVSVGAISLFPRPGAAGIYLPGPGSIFSLQTTTPLEIPVLSSGGAIVPYIPDRLGMVYRSVGGEVLVYRNDRTASIRVRVLASHPCQDGVYHHYDGILPKASWMLMGPFNCMEYQNSHGLVEFLALNASSGALLANAETMGVAVIRPFEVPL